MLTWRNVSEIFMLTRSDPTRDVLCQFFCPMIDRGLYSVPKMLKRFCGRRPFSFCPVRRPSTMMIHRNRGALTWRNVSEIVYADSSDPRRSCVSSFVL